MENLPSKEILKESLPTSLSDKTANIISCNSGLKIREMNPENTSELDEAIKKCFALIGSTRIPDVVNNPLDRFEMKTFKQFIFAKLKQYTANDIVNAYVMMCAGEIKIDLDHYGKISSQYLGLLMDAYGEFLRNAKGELAREQYKQSISKERVYTDEEIKNIDESFFKNMVLADYEKYVETGYFYVQPTDAKLVYQSMLNRGLITYEIAEKEAIYNNECEKYVNEFKKLDKEKVKINFWLRVIKDMFEEMKNKKQNEFNQI